MKIGNRFNKFNEFYLLHGIYFSVNYKYFQIWIFLENLRWENEKKNLNLKNFMVKNFFSHKCPFFGLEQKKTLHSNSFTIEIHIEIFKINFHFAISFDYNNKKIIE